MATDHRAERARRFAQQAWSAFEKGDYQRALGEFGRVLVLKHADEGGLQGQVAALRKLGRYPEATARLDEALLHHPTALGLLKERVWIALEQKQPDAAIDALGRTIAAMPQDEDSYLWKAGLEREAGRIQDVDETLKAAVARFPASTRVQVEMGWHRFSQKQFDEALLYFERALRVEPGPEPAHQGRAATLRVTGRFSDAITAVEDGLDEYPQSIALLNERGWLHFSQSRYADAEEDFRRSLGLSPDDPSAHVNLAWALVRQGAPADLQEAASLCREALRIEPRGAQACGCLGVVCYRQGKIRESELQFLRSIEIDRALGFHVDLASLYVETSRFDEALAQLQQAIQLDGGDAQAHLGLGSLYMQTEKPKDAIREFRYAMTLDPSHPEPPRALALALAEVGRLTDAEKVLRAALSTVDESRRRGLHLALCQVLTMLSDASGEETYLEDGLKEAGAAIRQDAKHADAHFHSGIVRYKLHDYEGALREFRRAHDLKHDYLEADLNARRVQAMLRSDAKSRVGKLGSYLMAALVLLNMVAAWFMFWSYKEKVSVGALFSIMPVFLGLFAVALLLPWLSRLKLTGLEAELATPPPKESLSSGPKGEIGFTTSRVSVATPSL